MGGGLQNASVPAGNVSSPRAEQCWKVFLNVPQNSLAALPIEESTGG